MRKYFGTDGIRGRANQHPMTAEVALRVAKAAGAYFARDKRRHLVVIGKDTRLSCYMIEPALVAGFTAAGLDVDLLGPMPTPAVAMLTKSMRADLGVMISASHNPYYDNGIKLFGPDGYKLNDSVELEIEALMEQPQGALEANMSIEPQDLGRVKRLEGAAGRYIEAVKRSFPEKSSLEGLKIALDCANGAAYTLAPKVLYELGAQVIPLGVKPDGMNINAQCGATSPEALQRAVLEHKADIGIALDGDADRLIVVDDQGKVVNGDQILALIATAMHQRGQLRGNAVVATLMTNIGFEQYLKRYNLPLLRTNVGDRYVLEAMQAQNCNLGGEQSGHLIMLDHATTGDGLIAALQVLSEMKRQNKPSSALLNVFTPTPQRLESINFQGANPIESAEFQCAYKDHAAALEKAGGRINVRKSGTEAKIRIMVECDDQALIDRAIHELVALCQGGESAK